ncbi:MAG: hypothetical protein GX077_05670 [Tissierellia bacterium]|nr:hypothetical protein [Tissierellia bacterium]
MVNPLSRVGMKNLVNKGPIISPSISGRVSISNLDEREEQLLLDLIKGQREVAEGINAKKTLTLEEAAERVKNKY